MAGNVDTISTTEFEDSVQIDLPGENEADYDMIERSSTKHEVTVTSCPVKNVTVFMDRAEVNRLVKVDVIPGDVEVLLKDLPTVIDKDSVRVTCYGEATIVEVAYQEKAITEKAENEDELKKKSESRVEQIMKSIKGLERSKLQINDQKNMIQDERDILHNFSKCVSSGKEDKVADVLEKKSVENLLSFLTVYKSRSEQFSNTLSKLNEKLEAIDKEIEVLQANLTKLQPVTEKFKTERNISVLLDTNIKGSVKLFVSYVVSNSSWTPLYDVRAFNKDSSVQILYFATIKQNTGEDWEDAKLSLSTAMPSVGGSPPDLPTQTLNIEKPLQPYRPKKSAFGFGYRGSEIYRSIDEERTFAVPLAQSFYLHDPTIEDSYGGAQQSSLPTAMATEGMTSTSFEIARLATIQSDDVGHKVSICQLDFTPEFEYMATPKAVAHAFLKIKTKNESAYAMLAGDANVFLDNNFLTKSSLPAVSPMEEFEIALGVDPAVKVTYKPLKKFQQTSGMISKSRVYNFHQQIEIKNTKTVAVKIKVTDQCPRVANEKIKLLLQEPEIKIPKATSSEPAIVKSGIASLHTADYKIDWVLDIPPAETKNIDLRYQVEHPLGSKISGL